MLRDQMSRTMLPVAALVVLLGTQSPSLAQNRPATRSAVPAVAGTVNINTASAAEFEALPGIGAKTAQRIVEYRQKNGPFKKIEDLMNIRGIGEKNFLKLRPQLTVAAQPAERSASQQR